MTKCEWFMVVVVMFALIGLTLQAIHIITLRIHLEAAADENERLSDLIEDSLARPKPPIIPAFSGGRFIERVDNKGKRYVEAWQYDEAIKAVQKLHPQGVK